MIDKKSFDRMINNYLNYQKFADKMYLLTNLIVSDISEISKFETGYLDMLSMLCETYGSDFDVVQDFLISSITNDLPLKVTINVGEEDEKEYVLETSDDLYNYLLETR